jgi:hypothetical protein
MAPDFQFPFPLDQHHMQPAACLTRQHSHAFGFEPMRRHALGVAHFHDQRAADSPEALVIACVSTVRYNATASAIISIPANGNTSHAPKSAKPVAIPKDKSTVAKSSHNSVCGEMEQLRFTVRLKSAALTDAETLMHASSMLKQLGRAVAPHQGAVT